MSLLLNKSYAQNVEFKYIHKFTIKEGLSSYNIRKIVKDEYGYVWVATQDGLNRFDGVKFLNYGPGASHQFNTNAIDIRDLIIDSSKHRLWVLTNINGVYLVNTTSGAIISHFPIPYTQPDDWSQCFRKIGTTLWIGCFYGVKVLDIEHNRWLPDPPLPANSKIISFEIGGITQDRNTNTWVFINDFGVLVYDQSRKLINSVSAGKLFGIPGEKKVNFNSPFQHTDSTIIVGTSEGLKIISTNPAHIEDKTWFNLKASFLSTDPIYSISFPTNGDIYIGLYGKTIKLDSELTVVTELKDKDGSSENTNWLGQARTILNDGKFTWIGSKEGLSYMQTPPDAAEIYSSSTSEFSPLSHIYDIEPVNKDELIAGGKNGLYLINRKIKTCRPIKTEIVVNNLFRDQYDNIIVTTTSGNFIYLNKQLSLLTAVYPELIPYKNNVFIDNIMIADSLMLIGTDDESGLIIWNYKRKKTFIVNTKTIGLSLASNTINDVYQVADGSICILGDKVITLLDSKLSTSKIIRLIDPKSKKELGPLLDIIETENNYWVCAYGDGLVKLDKTWNVTDIYKENYGLSNKGVYKVFNYGQNQLLITSNNGLSVFNYKTGSMKKIFEESGLHANTFEEATGCTRNNEIYCGGPNGFSILKIDSFRIDNTPPILYINAVSFEKAFNSRIDTFSNNLDHFHFPSNYIQATVSFSAIYYSNPLRIIYKYKIKEIQKDWITLGKQNFINFIGIKPGTYHLQVQAFNEDGVPSEIKELTLIFLPKWYQTLFFKILVALAIIAIGYALYRIRINQFKKEQQIRSKIASDLHDDLGSTMNSVKIYANLAIMEKQADKYLPLIKDGTQNAITGIRDIIWVLDDTKDSIEHLLSRINTFASPLCEANTIKFKLELPDNARDHRLGQEERRNLYMMLKEAVNNAVKYSGGQTIGIEVSITKGKPAFLVKDDGKGFDTAKSSEGNGLKNMQRRAREIKYVVQMNSSPGSGTAISFEKT